MMGSSVERRGSRANQYRRWRWCYATLVDLVAFLIIALALAAVCRGECRTDPVTGRMVCDLKQSPPATGGRGPAWTDARICQIDGGTGAFIAIGGEASYVLSCAHGLTMVGDLTTLTSRWGHRYTARVVAIDQAADVAILKFNGTAASPAAIAQREPPIGQCVWFAGFARGGPLRTLAGRITSYDDPTKGVANCAPTAGDSGAPVIDASGYVVGVLSGSEGGPLVFARLPRIQALIAKLTTGPTSPATMTPAEPSCAVPNPPLAAGPDYGVLKAELEQLRTQVNGFKSCRCDNAALVARLDALSLRLKQFEDRQPAPFNYDALATEVARRLPPIYFRVLDPRGAGYSTDYQPARLGNYVTLPFGPAQ